MTETYKDAEGWICQRIIPIRSEYTPGVSPASQAGETYRRKQRERKELTLNEEEYY